MDDFDESSDGESFHGFENNELEDREVDAGSNIDVSSVHTSDLSDWDDHINDFADENIENDDEEQAHVVRDRNGWTATTIPIPVQPFVQQTGPNIQLGEDRSPLFFFNQLFEPAMID